MPREIVRINVASKFPMAAGARFFATIAYPDNRNERERYQLALCRWYLHARTQRDPFFASKLHLIAPAIFVPSIHDSLRALKRGDKKLEQRFAATHWLVMPHLREERLEPIQLEDGGDLIVPTLNNMAFVAMRELGWTGKAESLPTFKSKIWAPSRPVVHAAAAYVLWSHIGARILPVERQVDNFFIRTCLERPSVVATLIQKSESFRLGLADIEQFKIKEEETIQILAEGTPLEFAKSGLAESTQKVC